MTSLFLSVSIVFVVLHAVAKAVIDYFGLDDVDNDSDDDEPYPCMVLT